MQPSDPDGGKLANPVDNPGGGTDETVAQHPDHVQPAGIRAPSDFLVITPTHQQNDRGEDQRRRNAADRLARRGKPLTLRCDLLNGGEVKVVLGGIPCSQPRSSPGPPASDDDRGVRALCWLGKAGRVAELIVSASMGEPLSHWVLPQSSGDGQLFFEPLKPLPQTWERNAVSPVFGFVAPRTETELDTTTTHMIHLRNRYRQRPKKAKGSRSHEGAQANTSGVSS